MIWHMIWLAIGVLLGWTSAFFIVIAHESDRVGRPPRLQ